MHMMLNRRSPDASASSPLLQVEAISVSYGPLQTRPPVLKEVSLSIPHGQTIGIIGESGSGKTTLAKVILGTVPAQSGTVRFAGQTLTGLGASARRKFRRSGAIQYVFQDPLGSLDPQWSVQQSIEEVLLLQARQSRQERLDAVLRTVALVGLDPDLLTALPGRLSGGQRQRVAIARALVGGPKLLIADEPVSALDSSSKAHVLELFASLRQQLSLTQIFISHDLGSVAALVDRVVVLFKGQIVEDGTPDEVIGNPRHAYTRQLVQAAPRLRIDS